MCLCATMADGTPVDPAPHPGLIKSQRGASVLVLVMVFGLAILIGQTYLMARQIQSYKETQRTNLSAARIQLLSMLDQMLAQQITIRNSRFNTNSELARCLTATPSPCDERISYDMILYAPNPPVIHQGGLWPAPIAGLTPTAGGLNSNKILFNAAGGRCDSRGTNEPSESCPMQAIIQFRPLCGGSVSIPDFQSNSGSVCGAAANGFEFTIGVGIISNGNFVYHADASQNGDAKVYRMSATVLQN
ncbi:MAG: hypothetical protein JNM39_06650 [Bdellovibrionaceae bacterium]|nr:hypothetical protein [Pseudobdellovibrionaceae bacterium]